MKILVTIITLVTYVLTCTYGGVPAEPEFLNVDIWPKSRNDGQLHEIIEDGHGYLWATSTFGVYRYDGQSAKGYFNSIDSTSLSNSFAEALFIDSNNDLWIGCADGLNRYRYATDDFERINMERVSGQRIYRIYEDARQNFWVGTGAGLVHLDRKSRRKELFVPDEWKRYSVHGMRAIAEDTDNPNIIWAGGVQGLFSLDKTSGKMRHYPMPFPNKEGWDCMINQMFLDSEGIMWCATWGGYLLSFNTKTMEWRQFTTGKVNVPYQDSVIFDLQLRDPNSLWVANGSGVGIFEKASGRYILYEHNPDNTFSLGASYAYFGLCLTRGGNLAVVGQSAVSISSPVMSTLPGIRFPPVIGSIMIGDAHVSTDSSVSELRYINMEDYQKDLSLTLTWPGTYFVDPMLSYRLEGYDRDWKTLTNSNAIRYTNLPKGSYVLRYRASIDGSTWVEGRPLFVTKNVFFWKTPAFFLFAGLLIVGIFFLVYFMRIRIIRREAALKTEFNTKIANIEMAALRAQMNPHFLFNSMNSIKYYILNEEPDLADVYLTKFSRLMRLVLRNSQTRLITLADEIEALTLYIEMEALRFKEDFTYKIDVDEEIDQNETFIPPLLIQPYVENAIWHGLLQKHDAGRLIVSIFEEGDLLHITVEDDGIGRAAAEQLEARAAEKKSFGTHITRDRIALVGRTLGIQANVNIEDLHANGRPLGTRVTIVLPVLNELQIQQDAV